MASSVRFKYPANGTRPPVDVSVRGGMRPPIPSELLEENKEFPGEGMMFVGDKGKFLPASIFRIHKLFPALKCNRRLQTRINALMKKGHRRHSPLPMPANQANLIREISMKPNISRKLSIYMRFP